MNQTPATTPTEAQLAEKFPCSADPYAVWFNPDATPLYRWAVNDEDGECIVDVRSYESAAKIAAALEGRAQVSAGVLCDIFTIHFQAVTSLAAVDGLPDSELANASDELLAVVSMLRDMKVKLAKLVVSVDAMQHTAPSKTAQSEADPVKQNASAVESCRALFGEHPEDVIAPINDANDTLMQLWELFKAISISGESPKMQNGLSIKRLADAGAYIALDRAQYVDCRYTAMIASLRTAGAVEV